MDYIIHEEVADRIKVLLSRMSKMEANGYFQREIEEIEFYFKYLREAPKACECNYPKINLHVSDTAGNLLG